MEFLTLALTSLVIFLVVVLLYTRSMSAKHGIFKELGVDGPAPWPIFGNFIQEFKAGFFQYHMDAYEKYKAKKVYGYYRTKSPIMGVCDLEMVRDITVRKFNHFVNRNVLVECEPPIQTALTMIKDDHWKNVRAAMSPAFSTSKLRRMYTHLQRTTGTLLDNLQEKQERNEPLELRDILSCYTMDLIASTGFGYEVNSLKDRKNPFLDAGVKIMQNFGRFLLFGFFLSGLMPIMKKLGIGLFPKDATDFFINFVDKAMERRHQDMDNGVPTNRHDFLQLFIESERDSVDENDNMTAEEAAALNVHRGSKKKISRMDVQGQALLFVLAGYETTSTAMSFTAFLLAMNPDCLRKVQEEIDQQLQGEFPTYDSVQKLTYLDMCLNESMRLYPPGFLIDRVCTEDVEVQGVHIPKDMIVQIPPCAIHRDPSLWPEPERFLPERFTPENKASRHPYAFMPFGLGPRNCVGMRLAQLELKVGLSAMLQKMTPVPCEKSVYPVRLDALEMKSKDGLWVKMEPRN